MTPWTAPPRLLCPWDFPGKDTGVICHFFLQGIFPTQGSNPGLLHCRQILHRLNSQESPLKWSVSCYVYKQGHHSHLRLQPSKCEFLSPEGPQKGEQRLQLVPLPKNTRGGCEKEGCWPQIAEVHMKGMSSVSRVQFSSVTETCLTLCDPMNCSTPGLPVHHQHPEFTQELISIESVMPSNHLILCRPLLLPPSIFPSIRVFSDESVLRIRWPKYWSFRSLSKPRCLHLPKHRKVLNSLT